MDIPEENLLEKEMDKLTDSTSKITLVIEQIKNSNPNVRLFCIKQLSNIAELLGSCRTEDELIPLILDHLTNTEDNEEVLYEISCQLISLIDKIPKGAPLINILKGLEILASNDDEIVRQKATDNLCELILKLDENIITNEIFPLMQRLIQNDMKSKVSCCYLFPVVYSKLLNEQIKKELIQAYYEISRDDSPSVRRAAALNIKNFASAEIDDNELLMNLVVLYNDMLNDNTDIVKVYAISSTQSLLVKLSPDQQKKLILNFNSVVNKDKSWRVKYAAAEATCDIAKYFDIAFNEQNFLPVLMLFLKNSEPEVRSSVVARIDNFVCAISPAKFISNLLPIFQDSILTDNNHHVRALFASSIVKCCKLFDAKIFEKNLYPLVSKILKDEVFEVRNSALIHFHELACFFSDENVMINLILPTISELSKDLKWRVRLSLCEKINQIADILPLEQFVNFFLPFVNNFFTDHALLIRDESINIFDKICKKSGGNFLKTHLWEIQKFTLNSTNYILRISALNSIIYLKYYYNDDFLIENILPIVFQLKSDNVPNVKFSLCNFINKLQLHEKLKNNKKFSCVVEDSIKILTHFELDNDNDVRYFAIEALNKLRN